MDRRLAALAFCMCALDAHPEDATQLPRVEVVGSRIPRIDGETGLPVQVIRREEIDRSGVQTVEDLLQRVSANFGGQREAMGLGNTETPGFSGASLRGLGAGETLVLLNGRRLANYAFTGLGKQGVDLHVIPLAAIDRVEILKDGASALYGSDAIAGVINFVTRKDYAGSEGTATYAAPEAGGGERTRLTVSLGRGDVAVNGFNVFGVVDAQKAERLRAIDRPFTSTSYHPEIGLDQTSSASFPANIGHSSNRLVNPATPDCTPLTVYERNSCRFDVAKTIDVVPPSQQLNLFARGLLRVTTETEAYAEVLYSINRIQYRASPTPASPVTAPGTTFVLPASSPYYPTGLGLSGDLDLFYRTLPLGSRISEVESGNARVLAGARSRVAEWDVDGALAFNDTRSTEHFVDGFVSASRLSAAIGTGLINPFGPSGLDGDSLLRGTLIQGKARDAEGRTQTADLRASRELVQLRGGPLALATGVEARHEYLRDVQGQVFADVAGIGVPAGPKEGSRTAQAAFVEVVAPLVKGFELQAAARIDRYSDFGTTVSPKLAARYQPAPSWLLRASAGRGFRAPSLPELYTQQDTHLVEGQPAPFGFSDPVRCPVTHLDSDCMPTVNSTTGGSPTLQPQRSTQGSVGLVFEQARWWVASVDFWSVHVKDIIGSLDFDTVVADIPAYEGRNVVRGPVDPAFPGLPGPIVGIVTVNENLGDWSVAGTDVSLSLQPVGTPLGRFKATLDGTYVFHARQEIFSGNVVDLMGRLAPRWQHTLTVSLDRGPWATTLSQRYRHGYNEQAPDDSTRRVPSYTIWDGQIAFSATPDVKIWLGIRNLLNTVPPLTNQSVSLQVGYDPVYADPQGRTWTVGVRVAWR